MVPARGCVAAATATAQRVTTRYGPRLQRRARALASSSAFRRAIVAFFIVDAITLILTLLETAALPATAAIGSDAAQAFLPSATGGGAHVLSYMVDVVATLIAAALIMRGLLQLRRSQAGGFRDFERAVLVDLLLAKPFEFFDRGSPVAILVGANLLLLGALRYVLREVPLQAHVDSASSSARDARRQGSKAGVDARGQKMTRVSRLARYGPLV